MKSALIHGVLLVIMGLYGYRAFTAPAVTPDAAAGSIAMWSFSDGDLTSVEYKTDKKTVTLSRRGDGTAAYWWGTEAKTETPLAAKPATPGADGSVSAAIPAGSVTTTREFPVGEGAEKVVTSIAAGRATLSLGVLDDAGRAQYGLDKPSATLRATFRAGVRTFLVGNRVNGEQSRYVLDSDSSTGYVLPADMVQTLDAGEGGLRLTDPLGFSPDELAQVELQAGAKQRNAKRDNVSNDKGMTTKTWADTASNAPDQTLANFIDNLTALRPTRFDSKIPAAELTTVVTIIYRDANGKDLGNLKLLRRDLPSQPGGDGTVTAPPSSEYFVQTGLTRVPGLVSRDAAGRVETDLATVLP